MDPTQQHIPQPGPNGAQYLGAPQSAPVQQVNPQPDVPDGFDAGDVWVFPYNLNPYVKAQGHVPPPTQARIDRFQRSMAKLMIDYQKAVQEAEEAQAKAEAQSEEGAVPELTMEEVDKALAERAEAVGRVKDAVADLCSGHPTRKQLEGLPEYVFMKFVFVLGRKVNPEV